MRTKTSDSRWPHSFSFPMPLYGPITSMAGQNGFTQFSAPPSREINSLANCFGFRPSCLTNPAVSLINHSSLIWLLIAAQSAMARITNFFPVGGPK